MPAKRISGKSLDMTRLTIAEAPEQGFSVRGRNATTDADDEGLIFYHDVTKVHVLPDDEDSGPELMEPAAVDPVASATPGDVLIAPDPDNVLEQIPSRPDERPRENLPDTQRRKKPLV